VCLSVIFSARYFKNDAARITKLDTEMFYDESWGHKTDKQCQCEFCTLVSAGFFYLFAVLSEGSGPYRLVVGYTPLTVAGSARQVATGIGIHLQRSIIITVTGNQFQLLSPTLQPTHGAVPPLG